MLGCAPAHPEIVKVSGISLIAGWKEPHPLKPSDQKTGIWWRQQERDAPARENGDGDGGDARGGDGSWGLCGGGGGRGRGGGGTGWTGLRRRR